MQSLTVAQSSAVAHGNTKNALSEPFRAYWGKRRAHPREPRRLTCRGGSKVKMTLRYARRHGFEPHGKKGMLVALDKIREVSVLVETKASHTDDLFSYNDTN